MFDDLAERVNANEALVRRGRYVNVTLLLEASEEGTVVRITDGRIASVTKGAHLMPSWDFALRAPREAWERFLQAKPAPGFTDIFALQRKKLLRIEGDLQPFMANLLYFKDVVASVRKEAA
jgi:hypothetical protein